MYIDSFLTWGKMLRLGVELRCGLLLRLWLLVGVGIQVAWRVRWVVVHGLVPISTLQGCT